MSWRIKSLILYQRNGPDRRKLEFRTHGINVITGNSQTGKSAVLDILNYILMSKSCPIPKGIIRRTVSHVGGHFVDSNGELLIIRPLPAPGHKVSTQGWYQLGNDLEFPNDAPEMTASRDVIRDVLSTFTGIAGAAVLSNPREPWEEVKAEANIRHASPLIFQPQDIIANRYVSVPGLDSEHHRRHMLDALPFLLGIEDANLLATRARLRILKSRLRDIQMKEKERERLRANTFSRGHRLWMEAQSLNLIEGTTPKSVPELLNVLRNIHVEEEKRFDIVTTIPDIQQLEGEEQSTRSAVQKTRAQIRALREFEKSTEIHQDVVAQQASKLSLSELLPSAGNHGVCPICDSESFDPERQRKQLTVALTSLEGMRAVPLRADAKARKARANLETELLPLEEQHEVARSKLREAVSIISKNATYLAADREIDRLLGRISEYIRTVDIGDFGDEQDDLDSLTQEIEALQKRIDSVWRRRKEIQQSIDETMTKLARRMEVEFQHTNASISVTDLSISVQVEPDSDEMTSLAEIGSGANWVCYHLAGILALHAHMARAKCPVPRTLLIDQPSQAWFPEELRITDQEGDLTPKDEEDTNRVRDIYRLLGEMAELDGFSQVIVMDHAKFKDDWFQSMVLREWRHGEKLVPDHWDNAQ